MSSAANTSSDNPITENPLDMAEDFGIGLAMVALVSILQHLAIAKFYTGKYIFLKFNACFYITIVFSNLNSNCSNLLDLKNLQEQVKKAFC